MFENKFGGDSEDLLVRGLKTGNLTALSAVYDQYAAILLGVITRIVHHPEIAEEVLKETFTAICSRITVYDPSASRFLTWALAIARGISIEAIKTGKYQHLAEGSEKIKYANAEEAMKRTLQDEKRVKQVFCHLEPQEKAILDLIYLKGKSCAEAAALLEISETDLKATLKMAFKHIGAERAA
ncbi:RNA polymerase sigma factor [Rufibacter soli]